MTTVLRERVAFRDDYIQSAQYSFTGHAGSFVTCDRRPWDTASWPILENQNVPGSFVCDLTHGFDLQPIADFNFTNLSTTFVVQIGILSDVIGPLGDFVHFEAEQFMPTRHNPNITILGNFTVMEFSFGSDMSTRSYASEAQHGFSVGTNVTLNYTLATNGDTVGGEVILVPANAVAAGTDVLTRPCWLGASYDVCHYEAYYDAYACALGRLNEEPSGHCVTFTPVKTTVGELNAQMMINADWVIEAYHTPNITVLGKAYFESHTEYDPLTGQYGDFLPGHNLTIQVNLTASGNSVSGEKVIVSNSTWPAWKLENQGSWTLRWGVNSDPLQSEDCVLEGYDWVCYLHRPAKIAHFTHDEFVLYFFLAPASTYKGWLELDFSFTADQFEMTTSTVSFYVQPRIVISSVVNHPVYPWAGEQVVLTYTVFTNTPTTGGERAAIYVQEDIINGDEGVFFEYLNTTSGEMLTQACMRNNTDQIGFGAEQFWDCKLEDHVQFTPQGTVFQFRYTSRSDWIGNVSDYITIDLRADDFMNTSVPSPDYTSHGVVFAHAEYYPAVSTAGMPVTAKIQLNSSIETDTIKIIVPYADVSGLVYWYTAENLPEAQHIRTPYLCHENSALTLKVCDLNITTNHSEPMTVYMFFTPVPTTVGQYNGTFYITSSSRGADALYEPTSTDSRSAGYYLDGWFLNPESPDIEVKGVLRAKQPSVPAVTAFSRSTMVLSIRGTGVTTGGETAYVLMSSGVVSTYIVDSKMWAGASSDFTQAMACVLYNSTTFQCPLTDIHFTYTVDTAVYFFFDTTTSILGPVSFEIILAADNFLTTSVGVQPQVNMLGRLLNTATVLSPDTPVPGDEVRVTISFTPSANLPANVMKFFSFPASYVRNRVLTGARSLQQQVEAAVFWAVMGYNNTASTPEPCYKTYDNASMYEIYLCNLTGLEFVAEQPFTLYVWFTPAADNITTLNIPFSFSIPGYYSDPGYTLTLPINGELMNNETATLQSKNPGESVDVVFGIVADRWTYGGEQVSVDASKIYNHALSVSTNYGGTFTACPLVGSTSLVCNLGLHFQAANATNLVLRFTPSFNTTSAGMLNAEFIVTATTFRNLRITPPVHVMAQMMPAFTSASPTVVVTGGVVMMQVTMQATADSTMHEKIYLSAADCDVTAPVRWGTTANMAQSTVCSTFVDAVVCDLSGTHWTRSGTAIYVWATPVRDTVGPWNTTLTFAAADFANASVMLNTTVIGTVAASAVASPNPVLHKNSVMVALTINATGNSMGGERVLLPTSALYSEKVPRIGLTDSEAAATECLNATTVWSCPAIGQYTPTLTVYLWFSPLTISAGVPLTIQGDHIHDSVFYPPLTVLGELMLKDLTGSGTYTTGDLVRLTMMVRASVQTPGAEQLVVSSDAVMGTVYWAPNTSALGGTPCVSDGNGLEVCDLSTVYTFVPETWLPVTLWFTPANTSVGPWVPSTFAVRATGFQDTTINSGVTVNGVMYVDFMETLPSAYPRAGEQVTMLLAVDVTGSTTGVPKLSAAADKFEGRALQYHVTTHATGLGYQASALTACPEQAGSVVCSLSAMPVGNRHYFWLSFTPENTTAGPLNLTLTFSADHFNTRIVTPRLIVLGKFDVNQVFDLTLSLSSSPSSSSLSVSG